MLPDDGRRGPPLPHLRLPDFLAPAEHAALLAWTLANEARFAPARIAVQGVDRSVRDALCLRDLGPSRAAFEARVAAAVPGWIEALRVTRFHVTEIELELTASNHGAHFVLHADTYGRDEKARGDRMLSAVYYYHREPRGFDGGELRLHRIGARAGDLGTDIPPDQNSLVVFPSWGPHEVLPVTCASRDFADSRFGVNCWVYRARN